MNWIDNVRKDYNLNPKPAPGTCPECFKPARVSTARTERNKGRPFLVCDCGFFKWLDLPKCGLCGEDLMEGFVRGGKNKGKRYRSCPMRCPGSFAWLLPKPKT